MFAKLCTITNILRISSETVYLHSSSISDVFRVFPWISQTLVNDIKWIWIDMNFTIFAALRNPETQSMVQHWNGWRVWACSGSLISFVGFVEWKCSWLFKQINCDGQITGKWEFVEEHELCLTVTISFNSARPKKKRETERERIPYRSIFFSCDHNWKLFLLTFFYKPLQI
jgi:hypothetical protein